MLIVLYAFCELSSFCGSRVGLDVGGCSMTRAAAGSWDGCGSFLNRTTMTSALLVYSYSQKDPPLARDAV